MPEDATFAYRRVKEALLGEIERGEYEFDVPFTTEREVCSRFGVSSTTAVRALNDLVREGVLVRRRGRGTFVAAAPPRTSTENAGATAARTANRTTDGRSRTIGCVFRHLKGAHVFDVIRGIESVCKELDHHLLLFDSEESTATEAENLRRAEEAGVSGLVVFPVDGYANAPQVENLVAAELPLVMVDRYYPALPTDVVVPDNFAVGHDLTDYLLGQGHRHIGTLWGETSNTSLQDRLTGHKRALYEAGVPLVPELAALRSYDKLPVPQRRALLRSWLDAPYRPTVLVAVNGYILALAANDLIALGVDLHSDLALAGMDDAGPYDILPFAAATVALPSREMGREAVRLLLERVDRPGPARHLVLPVEVSPRPSATGTAEHDA